MLLMSITQALMEWEWEVLDVSAFLLQCIPLIKTSDIRLFLLHGQFSYTLSMDYKSHLLEATRLAK